MYNDPCLHMTHSAMRFFFDMCCFQNFIKDIVLNAVLTCVDQSEKVVRMMYHVLVRYSRKLKDLFLFTLHLCPRQIMS